MIYFLSLFRLCLTAIYSPFVFFLCWFFVFFMVAAYTYAILIT